MLRYLIFPALILLLSQSAWPASPVAKPAYPLEGFRSARFGMTEAQVRGVIGKDFGVGDDAIRKSEQPIEKTTLLVVDVPVLKPAVGGPARVLYVFGHQSRKLMEVSVFWGPGEVPDSTVTVDHLQQTLASITAYFGGFAFKDIVKNKPQPDGTTLIWMATDARGRMVAMLSGKTKAGAAAGKLFLRLTYQQNPKDRDVYRGVEQLRRGDF